MKINKIEKNIINIYIIFWCFFLLYDYIRYNTLGIETYFLVIISIFSFYFGWFLFKKKTNAYNKAKNSDFKIKFLVYSTTILNFILLSLATKSIIINGFNFRQIIFTDDGFLENYWLTFLYNNIIQPLIISTIIISMCLKDKKYLKYAYLNLLIMSVLSIGRFPIYYMIYFMVINYITNHQKEKITAYKYFIFIIILLLVAWYLLASKLNHEGIDLSNFEILENYLINYHLIGFHMLDNFIKEDQSNYIYTTTSMGILGWYIHLLTKYSYVLPIYPNSFMDMMEKINGGLYFIEFEKHYNAFCTSILPFYADGGYFGVVIGFIFFGWISTRGSNIDIYKVNPFFLLTVFMLTFSLFQPFINLTLPICLIFIWVVNKFLLE